MRIAAFSFDVAGGHFQDKWKEYYQRHCDQVDVVIDTSPNCRDVYRKFKLITPNMVAKQTELFKTNDIVVYADIDEYLIPDPNKYAGFRQYLEKWYEKGNKVARATGMNVIQTIGEPALDWTKPFLTQRRYWSKAPFYSKVNIARAPTSWSDGMMCFPHYYDQSPDPYLTLVHLKSIDYEEEIKRGRERRGYPNNERFMDHWVTVTQGAVPIPDRFKIL